MGFINEMNKALLILKCLKNFEQTEPKRIIELTKIPKATFYRYLDKLKELGFIVWNFGAIKITQKGLNFLSIMALHSGPQNNNNNIEEPKDEIKEDAKSIDKTKDDKESFKILPNEELKKQKDNFNIFLVYPTTSNLINDILDLVGEEKKGTNQQKLKNIIENHQNKNLSIGILNFEKANTQFLRFMELLIKHNVLGIAHIGYKDKKELLQTKKEFLKEFGFTGEGFEFENSVNLFPIMIISVVGLMALFVSHYILFLIPLYIFRRFIYSEFKG